MKLIDLVTMENVSADIDPEMDRDVLDNITGDSYPALCGSYKLSEEAMEEFPALQYKCSIEKDYLGNEIIIVECDDDPQCEELSRLLYALAGYISAKQFDRYFEIL